MVEYTYKTRRVVYYIFWTITDILGGLLAAFLICRFIEGQIWLWTSPTEVTNLKENEARACLNSFALIPILILLIFGISKFISKLVQFYRKYIQI